MVGSGKWYNANVFVLYSVWLQSIRDTLSDCGIKAVIAAPVHHRLACAEVSSEMVSSFVPAVQPHIAEAATRDNHERLDFPAIYEWERIQVME